MKKLHLIFFLITALINLSCKKNISIENVENQSELDSLIIHNLNIPFNNYDTIFICKPFNEVCGTVLPAEQEVKFNKRYDIKFDTIIFFKAFQNRIHKPVLKWTHTLYNSFDSIISSQLDKKKYSSDSLFSLNRKAKDSLFYRNKVFISFYSSIISNDSIQFTEFYRNSRNVFEVKKTYVYKSNWGLRSIKFEKFRYGWFYPSINY